MRFHGANQDCSLAGGTQAATKFCASSTLQVGYGSSRPYKSVLKFDVAAAIPAYATATASRFLAWQFPSTTKAQVSSRLRTITSDWDNNATWNARKTNTPWTTPGSDVSTDPNLTGAPTTINASGYWSYWDAPLTTVNGWINGTLPNYGFQLATDLTGPTDVKSAYGFTSTDGAQNSWPALEVTWVPDTTAPTGLVPAPGEGAADQDYLGGSQTVTINASAQDDASGIAQLELLRDDTNVEATATISCPGTICPLSAGAPLNLTTTGLTEGAHTLALRATDGAGNVTTTSPWTVYVDRTAPLAVNEISLDDYDSTARVATIGWSDAEDPNLADGSLGSGVNCEAKIDIGVWTLADGVVTVTANLGDVVAVMVRCTDMAGNRGPEQLTPVTVNDIDGGDAAWVDFTEGQSAGAQLAVTTWGDTGTQDGGSGAMTGAPISVKSTSGSITTRLTSDDGVAYFSLAPGTYQVWATQTSDAAARAPKSVVVAASGMTAHRIDIDLSQPAFQAALRSLASDGGQWYEQAINAAYCTSKIKGLACNDLRVTLDRTMRIEVILWGLDTKDDLKDTTRMNAFQHAFGTAWFIRIIQQKYGDDRKAWIARQEPADAFDAIMHNEAAAQHSDIVDTRRASFQDRNNNRVGNGYQRTHSTRNAVQLCSAMRAKAFHARKISFTDGKDAVPNPPPAEQVRLIFRYKYAAADLPDPAANFPSSHPCSYAFSKVE